MKMSVLLTKGDLTHNYLIQFILRGICELDFCYKLEVFSNEKCFKKQCNLILIDINDLNLINNTIDLAIKIKQIDIYKNIPIVIIITGTSEKMNDDIKILEETNIFKKIILNPIENIEQFRNDIKDILA